MSDSGRWLLLLHQLPPKPDYLRVKIRRRLAGLGAALVKNSVYVLPNNPESLEDFQWLRQEIEAANGSALIAEASFVEGISDEEIEAMLVAERVDAADERSSAIQEPDRVGSGRTWVTRQGVFVDRIASAWLIRRFIDERARFKFVAAQRYRPAKDELRFDMVGAEYTHVGEDCTFQTLIKRFGLDDRALAAIGEIVHDIDCKDEKYSRPETAGVLTLLRGIAGRYDDDEARMGRGVPVFDDLYAFYSTQRGERQRMKWITRERPKIDRVACPWLIARFIDREPEFLFEPPSEVLRTAAATGATPYDVDGVELSHDGPLCSFDALLRKYNLEHDGALADLAVIVRGADTARLDLAPQCAGLLAVSLGLSRIFTDDHEQLRHGFVVYDALYAWLREGRAETHTWNPQRSVTAGQGDG